MTPAKLDPALVTQEDRDAAADFVRWQQKATTEWQRTDSGAIQFFATDFSRGLRQGIWDEHPVIQAFARHRLAAIRETTEKAAAFVAGCAERWSSDQASQEYRDGFEDGVCDATGLAGAALRRNEHLGEM